MTFGTEPLTGDDESKVSLRPQPKFEPVAKSQTKSIAREIIETIILTVFIFLAVRTVVQNFKVEGFSMEPTLHTGQYLLVNKAAYFHFSKTGPLSFLPGSEYGKSGQVYLFGGPQRGDIIVFEYPEDPSRDFIKRIIGLPGDVIEIKDSRVFVNGVGLNEPYVKEAPGYELPAPVTVPQDSVFVMGDNRNNSSDSHIWGPLPLAKIIGKGWLCYWPAENWGLLPHAALSEQLR